MNISDEGIELIKKFEGLRLEVYDDVAGKPTIGYGHLIKDGEQFDTITEDQADNLLRQDTVITSKCVSSFVRYPLSQNEFDAVCCLTFNIGCRALQSSTLLRLINLGEIDEAAEQFLRWNYAKVNGQLVQVQGLTNRRIAERALFLGVV